MHAEISRFSRPMRVGYLPPRFENAFGVNRIPTVTIAIRMQPFQQPAHVVPGRFSRSAWSNPQNAIAISSCPKQHLLKIEPGGLYQNLARFTRPRNCGFARLWTGCRNPDELQNVGGKSR